MFLFSIYHAKWKFMSDLEKTMFYKINDVCLRISPEQQPAPMVLITFTGFVITSSFFEILKRVHDEMYGVRMHTSHILSLN